ncbi:McrB family protein [Rufibacter roseolus]|uniref:McrB family protein n=1 Tax=Rufibacter roseolus TaxID=2817375 RepID=UPI001FF050AB|nr:AAA family ATPase [Rufibacter roseolus]
MVDSITTLIEKYKSHLQENTLAEESYKWSLVNQFKGRPNLDAPDIYEEIKSINYGNLIFHNGIGVIRHLAKDRPEQTRSCLKVLFNEELPLEERLSRYSTETLKIYRELQPNEKHSHHQDERTMATLLAFHNPDKYPFYKDTFYQKYCKLLGIKPKPPGEKYPHYLELVNKLIKENIDAELIALVNHLLPADGYPDPQHKILAQDILYRMLDKSIEEAEREFRNYLKKFSPSDLTFYFETLDQLTEDLGITDTPNLVFSTKSGQLSFHIGRRYCLVLGNGQFSFIAPEGYEVPGADSSYFSGGKNPVWIKDTSAATVLQHYPALKEAVSNEQHDKKSAKPKEYDNPVFRKAAFDKAYRANFYDFTTEEMIPAPDKKEAILPQHNQPLNQILFGPPGTGKTYHTVNKALAICGFPVEGKTRIELKNEFDKKVAAGQIVFTTFHQSMSYEDFIEGIKPVTPKKEGDSINYEVIGGIFKKACALAAQNCYQVFANQDHSIDEYTFDDLYDAFISDVQSKISQGIKPIFKSIRGSDIEIKEINSNNSIIARHKESIATSSAPLRKEHLQKLYDKFNSASEINDLQQIMDTVQISIRLTEFYAVFKGIKEFETNFQPDAALAEEKAIVNFNDEEIEKKFNSGVYTEAIKSHSFEAEPVIIIIDEINRGNVSQIFGELITLVEEDKRLGKDEALQITLPYSKEKFGVPANLFIIGTMNTADRSVEALDTALRRRFSFEEMPPRPELITTEGKLSAEGGEVAGIHLADLLHTINKRIEKLLDKDHLIGHSFFMGVHNLAGLKAVFQNKINPLLQEYFFGDFGKIGLVLGKAFFEKEALQYQVTDNLFAEFEDYGSSDLSSRPVYRLTNLLHLSDAEFISAVNALLRK